MQHGFTLNEACALDSTMRVAFIYAIQIQKGAKVDWKTGDIKHV